MEMTKELKKYFIILFILGCLFIGYVVNSKQYVSGEMIQHVMEMGNIAGMNSGVLKAISEAKTNRERIVPNEKYLEEFVEQVELSLSYEEWFEKSTIPDNYRKNPLEVVVFWKDGDYYFIPADTCNDEIEIDGAPRPVEKNRYQENAWYFYTLRQSKKARLVDEYWYLGWEATLSEKKTKALTYLGEVEIDATGTTMPPVSALEENEYTDAIIDYLSRCPELPEGDYRVYFGKYEYYPDDSEVWFTGVIEQSGVCRYFMGNICMSEDGSYTARCDHGNGYSEWFPTTEEVPADVGVVEHILEAKRLVLDLTIKWDSE